jgi:Ca2+-binding EF-hand superfamily protein
MMKRISSFVGALITTAVLAGCGSQTEATFAPIQNSVDSTVSAQSAEGLKSFYTLLTEKVFISLDTNKDKQISFDEFKNRPNMTPGFSGPPPVAAQPQPAMTTQIEPVTAADAAAPAPKPAAPLDPLQVFLKIDKNKNGRLTLAEAKASRYFLGVSQQELRKMFKPLFDNFDADKNKSVSKEEFLKSISGLEVQMQQNMMSLFYTADKNLNDSLTFSEYEDLLYASIKAVWDVPNQAPAPQPNPNPPADPGQPDTPAPQPADPNQPAPAPAQP